MCKYYIKQTNIFEDFFEKFFQQGDNQIIDGIDVGTRRATSLQWGRLQFFDFFFGKTKVADRRTTNHPCLSFRYSPILLRPSLIFSNELA